MDNGIVAEGLVREFKGGIRAVDGIDLDVAPGEIYGFLGPNGAGKSTTVHMLTTLLPPTSGSARVAGFDVIHQGPQVRRAIGAALQEAALDPLLTGREKTGAEGTTEELKDQIGRRTVEAVPRDGTDPAAIARILDRFGERTDGSPKGISVRLTHGTEDLAGIVRALDSEGIEVEHLQ